MGHIDVTKSQVEGRWCKTCVALQNPQGLLYWRRQTWMHCNGSRRTALHLATRAATSVQAEITAAKHARASDAMRRDSKTQTLLFRRIATISAVPIRVEAIPVVRTVELVSPPHSSFLAGYEQVAAAAATATLRSPRQPGGRKANLDAAGRGALGCPAS